MASLNVYEVELNGNTVHLKLSDDDAKKYPDAKKVGSVDQRRAKSETRKSDSASTKKADAPANKGA